MTADDRRYWLEADSSILNVDAKKTALQMFTMGCMHSRFPTYRRDMLPLSTGLPKVRLIFLS